MSSGLITLNKSQHKAWPCPEIIRAVWDSWTCLGWIYNQAQGGTQCTHQYGQGSLHLLRETRLGQYKGDKMRTTSTGCVYKVEGLVVHPVSTTYTASKTQLGVWACRQLSRFRKEICLLKQVLHNSLRTIQATRAWHEQSQPAFPSPQSLHKVTHLR